MSSIDLARQDLGSESVTMLRERMNDFVLPELSEALREGSLPALEKLLGKNKAEADAKKRRSKTWQINFVTVVFLLECYSRQVRGRSRATFLVVLHN
jgi:hypothetical protein